MYKFFDNMLLVVVTELTPALVSSFIVPIFSRVNELLTVTLSVSSFLMLLVVLGLSSDFDLSSTLVFGVFFSFFVAVFFFSVRAGDLERERGLPTDRLLLLVRFGDVSFSIFSDFGDWKKMTIK